MPSQNETPEQDLEQVALMSSGYEWTCPNCDHLNNEIEIPKTVICEDCIKKYEVMDADHALE